MNASGMIDLLWRFTWIGSVAILLVLALRPPLRRLFGSGIAYAAWALVPVAWLALLLPAPVVVLPVAPVARAMVMDAAPMAAMPAAFDPMPLVIGLWLLGALAMAGAMLRQQRRFVRGLGALQVVDADAGILRAQGTAGLPALVGLLHPRIVLPADVDTRYAGDECHLMLAHEHAHRRRGDLWVNAAVAAVRCLQWFNPVVHVAGNRLRHDQELACDERVVADHPQSRRAYADAMLKTLVATQPVPLGCHWGITHPIKERIMMLKQERPARRLRLAGAVVVGLAALGAGFGAWSAQPATVQAGAFAEDFQLDATVTLNDGQPHAFTIRNHYGAPFSISADEPGAEMALSGTLVPVVLKSGRLGFDIATELRVSASREGVATVERRANPRIVVRADQPANIQIGQETNGRFAGVKIALQINPRDAQSALKQAKPFVPAAAPPAPPAPPALPAVNAPASPAPPSPPAPPKPHAASGQWNS